MTTVFIVCYCQPHQSLGQYKGTSVVSLVERTAHNLSLGRLVFGRPDDIWPNSEAPSVCSMIHMWRQHRVDQVILCGRNAGCVNNGRQICIFTWILLPTSLPYWPTWFTSTPQNAITYTFTNTYFMCCILFLSSTAIVISSFCKCMFVFQLRRCPDDSYP